MSARLAWAAQVAAVDRWKGAGAAPSGSALVVLKTTQGQAALQTLIGGRVYDGEAPRDGQGALPPLPYVVLDTVTTTPQNTLGTHGGNATFSGSVWSGQPSNEEPMAILAAMEDALRAKLELPGFTPARLKMEFATTVVAGDNLRHLPFRCRIISLEAEP